MGKATVGTGVLTVEQKLDLVIELVAVRGRKNCLKAELDVVLDAGDVDRFNELAPALERVSIVERELSDAVARA